MPQIKTFFIEAETDEQVIIDVMTIALALSKGIETGLDVVGEAAEEVAKRLVPVRKVFATGRKNVGSKVFAETEVRGRQEVRSLSAREANAERFVRKRLGLPSAFPTTAAGKRVTSAASTVQTAQFPTYRSRSRSNPGSDWDMERRQIIKAVTVNQSNRLGTFEKQDMVKDQYGRLFDLGPKAVPKPELEAKLTARGRYELKRATGDTLGGALKQSIIRTPVAVTRVGMKTSVSAGNEKVNYAKYVEFGTRRSRAQPFLRPALARAREMLAEEMANSIRRATKG